MDAILVVPDDRSGWEVRRSSAHLAEAHFGTREEALEAANHAVEIGEADHVEVLTESEDASAAADEDRSLRYAVMAFAAMGFAVFSLLVILSLIGIDA
jgi:hypothetical protein